MEAEKLAVGEDQTCRRISVDLWLGFEWRGCQSTKARRNVSTARVLF
jgi:hypothetical protein